MALLLADRDAELPEEKNTHHRIQQTLENIVHVSSLRNGTVPPSHFCPTVPESVYESGLLCRVSAYVVDCQNNGPLYAPLSC